MAKRKIVDIKPVKQSSRKRSPRRPEPTVSLPESKLNAKEEFLASLAKTSGPEQASASETPKIYFEEERPRPRKGWLLALILIFGLVFGTYGLGFTVSRAEMELRTAKVYQPFEFEVRLKQSPSEKERNQGILPLERVVKRTTITNEYQATGEGEVSSRAHGKITIYNAYSTQPQTLIEKTRFQAPDGKIFRIQKRIVVPGGKDVGGVLQPGSLEVEVFADQPGQEYNIEPTRLTIPGLLGTPRFAKFYAESKEKFVGGAKGKGKMVTQDDINKARQNISQLVFEDLKNSLSQGLPENVRFLAEASQLKVLVLEANAKAGDGLEKFKVTIDSQLTALLFDEILIKELARQRSAQPPTTDYIKPVYNLSYEIGGADFDAGSLTLKVKGSRNVGESIDVLALKQAIRGKSAGEVKKEILILDGIDEAKVFFWPFWTKRMPAQVDRITVTIK